MNRHSWKRIAIEIILIFVLSLTPLLWFRAGTIFVGHDNTYPLQARPFFENRLHTWSQNFFGHDQSLIMGTIPIHALDSLPTYVGFDRITGQKIVYVTWFFLIGLSAYVLATVLRPTRSTFKGIAVLFYQFNFFILQGWWIGEKSKFSAYIAQPLVLAVFILVTSGRMRVSVGSILISVTLFFFNAGGLYGIPLYGGLMVIIASFLLWIAIQAVYQKNWSALRRVASLLILSAILTILSNAYYIVPAIAKFRARFAPEISQIGGISGVISWAGEISANASLLNLMRLQGIPEWYDNPQHPYAKDYLTSPILIGVSFLLPLLVFASLLVVKKREHRTFVILFFLIYLVGMFFTAGTHPPVGFIYQMLIEKLPGFIIFRSPYFKFASSLMLAQAFLSAYTLNSLSGIWRRRVIIVAGIGLLVYHGPYFAGNFFSWREGYSTRLAVPDYVYSFGNWMEQHKDARVLMVPPNSPDYSYSTYLWGYLSFQSLPTLVSKNSAIINNDQLNGNERELVYLLYKALANGDRDRTAKLVSLLGITHVMIQHDTSANITSVLPLEAAKYEEGLKASGQFRHIIQFGAWDLYEMADLKATKFALASGFNTVVAQISDTNILLDHLDLPTLFIDEDDVLEGEFAPFIVADCANCPKKGRPIVVFPNRPVLPDDPFYPIVTLLDRFRPIPKDPKSAIYSLLGMTLKQISEFNEIITQQKPISSALVDTYADTLNAIVRNFDRLPTLKEKVTTAADIAQYLREERNFLKPNLGRFVTGGTQTVLVGRIFSAISNTEQKFGSFSKSYGDVNTRVYQIIAKKSFPYRIYIRIDDVNRFISEAPVMLSATFADTKMNVQLDKNDTKATSPILLGTVNVSAGNPVLQVTLPDVTGALVPLQPIETEFSSREENRCFGATIGKITGKSLYQFLIDYTNDYSDNLLLFIWEKDENSKRLAIAARLAASTLRELVSGRFEVGETTKEVILAVCAPNITEERASENMEITFTKMEYPGVILVPQNRQETHVSSPPVSDHGPTHYAIHLPTVAGKKLLVFNQRFDPWWELTGISAKHILVNGYANGWLIDNPNGQAVTLTYRGEEFFRWGIIVTVATLCIGSVFLWHLRRRFYA